MLKVCLFAILLGGAVYSILRTFFPMDLYLNLLLIKQEIQTLVSFQDSFRGVPCEDPDVTMERNISPYAVGSATCSCMKHPKPERFVVTLGMPITVHSAAREQTKNE